MIDVDLGADSSPHPLRGPSDTSRMTDRLPPPPLSPHTPWHTHHAPRAPRFFAVGAVAKVVSCLVEGGNNEW